MMLVTVLEVSAQDGHIRYREQGNTKIFGRDVMVRTDHTNLDTLTSVYNGSFAYDTTNEVVVFYDGSKWTDVATSNGGTWTYEADSLTTSAKLVGIGTTAPSSTFHIDAAVTNDTPIITVENTAGDVQIFRVDENPEGTTTSGSIGDIAIDGTNGNIYIKHTGSETNTGWENIYHSVQMGEIYSETETTITGSSSTKTLIDNTTTLSSNSMGDWDSPSDGRLRYTGTKTMTFHAGATISFKSTAGNNQQIELEMRKNGTKITGSKVLSTADNAEYASTAIHIFAQLATNDYLEIYVINNTGSNNVVVNSFNLFNMSLR